MSLDIYRLAFARVKGLRPDIAREILSRTGSEEAFMTLSEGQLRAMLGFDGKILGDAYRNGLLEDARRESQFIEAHGLACSYFTDPAYPRRMLECDDAPLMLFTLGNVDLNATHCLSIVGTRNATTYGVSFINRLVDELAERMDGLLIISGLAVGCDITAHKRAMERGIPTAAVVAHGLDTIFPADHRNIAARMVRSGGILVTEYPSHTRPIRPNSLARNRIIAGMSDTVIVAESAAARGGALRTARLGMLYNRDVFALPGRTSDLYSGGCNALIKSNTAHLIETADDLISTMGWTARPREGDQERMFPELTPEQQAVVDFIRHNGEAQTNTLSASLGIPAGKLMALLIELEFNGTLVALPGARYRMA